MEEIINKVALSGLITIDLEDYYDPTEKVFYNLKENLFMGLILKEKDFRDFLKTHNWEQYRGKHVAIGCTEEAIVPTWAYMLLAIHLEPLAKSITFGSLEVLEEKLFTQALQKLHIEEYSGKKVVIKGCSKVNVPIALYVEISRLLRPVAQSIMYGEPCSTVPLYKRKG